MTHLRRVAAAIAAGLAFAAAAHADDEWKTVTLDGKPDFTVSIPAVVSDYAGHGDPDIVLSFSVVADGHGALLCMASSNAYPKEAPQESFAAALATERREHFCKENGGTIGNVDIGGSTSFMHNGAQAAECTASYTDSANKLPGRVESKMVIAAPAKVYFLSCTTEDEDQETAEYEWATLWEATVRHIQKSFHQPK